jgi:glycyl-tRNA synthetase beta chain
MTSSNEVVAHPKKTEYLLEIFSEEIPARMQEKAAADLKSLVTAKLKEAGLKFDAATAYVTARRLTLHIAGLDAVQPDVNEERRGPKADAPERAIEGFLKSVGMPRDQIEIREMPKGNFLFAVTHKKGRKTPEVLAEFLPELIRRFPWPKSMKWGAGSLRWVRPVHSILSLLDGAVVEFTAAGEITSSNKTTGHRFMGSGEFDVADFADYKAKLAKNFVVLDREERKDIILQASLKLAADEGLELVDDPALLNELAGLSEYPLPVLGKYDEKYLAVPPEALTSAMRTHQKYFSLKSSDGKLANRFITVSNMKTADHQAAIISGNERVLNARLADTKFFWDQDLKHKLEDRIPKLDQVSFHAKLGSVGMRVERLADLADGIASDYGFDSVLAREAGRLSKSDLLTGMVDECPELQGLMGKYFADVEGKASEIGEALADQYSPKGPNDRCPTDGVSIALALADKLDLLVCFFAIDEKPTGSKDPYALRRAALGVIRLIVENKIRMDLENVLSAAISFVDNAMSSIERLKPNYNPHTPNFDQTEVLSDLMKFFADRLKVHLKSQGVRHDLITAVFSQGGESDLVRLLERVNVLQALMESDDGINLLAGYKRAANILRIEEKKDSTHYDGAADLSLMSLEQEKTLFKALTEVEGQVKKAVEDERFEDAMTALATLRSKVDSFFDDVIVNSTDESERVNRLKLLSQIRATMNLVADFSKIEG